MKSPITTHILDTSSGYPAKGVDVVLEREDGSGGWDELARGVTDDDGRITDLLSGADSVEAGVYRLTFEVGDYYRAQEITGFYPRVPVIFHLREPTAHYHVPLLLNPYGYSTYRGS